MELEEDGFGVVAFDIEADNYQALIGACMIACVENKKASHYVEGKDADGGNYISLRWTDGKNAIPLPFALETPKEIADFLKNWLRKNAVMPHERPDTDGSTNAGFKASIRDFCDLITIKTVYIIYGK